MLIQIQHIQRYHIGIADERKPTAPHLIFNANIRFIVTDDKINSRNCRKLESWELMNILKDVCVCWALSEKYAVLFNNIRTVKDLEKVKQTSQINQESKANGHLWNLALHGVIFFHF